MKIKKPIHKSRLLAFKDEKLLVLERIGLKKRYTLPGGITKKNETDCHSLIREAEEEIGVLFDREDLNFFISRPNTRKDKSKVYKHYFTTTKNIKNAELLEPEKFQSVSWIPWYEAIARMDKEDRSAVLLYFDKCRQEAKKSITL